MPHILAPLTGRTTRCILFDLGSTLWTYRDDNTVKQAELKAEQRAFAVLRRHLNPQDAARLETLAPYQLGKAIYANIIQDEQPGTGIYTEPDVARATVAGLKQLGFPDVSPAIGAEVFEAMRLRIPETRAFFNDALPTLAALKACGFKLGIVTNRGHGGEAFREDLETIGFSDYIGPRNIAVSIDLNIRKPDSRIFQYTLDALEVSAAESVMVGDQLGADVYGAQHLGIYGVWKPNPRIFAEARDEAGMQSNENLPPLGTLKRIALSRMKHYRPDRATLEALQPDMVIEHLRELLDVFVKVGTQE
ncbi:MAG TPA: hypothetical protein DHW02_15040 [Ktedonobacter sp.]|nr:hypothetical protein [Ktedonobacter sp.]